jgi:integrase/recombinase XerD
MDLREQLEVALPRFLRRCDATSTRLAYKRELVRFLTWLPSESTEELLFDYRDHLRARELGPTTVRWRTTVVRSFLEFAHRRKHIDHELAGDFKPPKGKSGFAPRVLTRAELERLIAAPDRRTRRGKRDALVLVLLGVGGLRASEVCRLNTEDIVIQSDRVIVHVLGKGKKERLVPVPGHQDLVQGYLDSWLEARGQAALILGGHRGREAKRLTLPGLDYLVRRQAAAAEIVGISAHSLRHTAASLAVESGEPLHRLRDRLGHSSVLVTSRYLHVG